MCACPRARTCGRTCIIATCSTRDIGGGLGDVCCGRCSSGRGVAVGLGAALPALEEPLSLEGIGRCTIPDGRSGQRRWRCGAEEEGLELVGRAEERGYRRIWLQFKQVARSATPPSMRLKWRPSMAAESRIGSSEASISRSAPRRAIPSLVLVSSFQCPIKSKKSSISHGNSSKTAFSS